MAEVSSETSVRKMIWELDPRHFRRLILLNSVLLRPNYAGRRRIFSLPSQNCRACISFEEYTASQAVLGAPIA